MSSGYLPPIAGCSLPLDARFFQQPVVDHPSTIDALFREYPGDALFTQSCLKINPSADVANRGFIGSHSVVQINTRGSIRLDAPGCLAAPVVTMASANTVSIGMDGQGKYSIQTRLYIPVALNILTNHLELGLFGFVEGGVPSLGAISCQKLTFKGYPKEPCDFEEIVKSWSVNDHMEIERI